MINLSELRKRMKKFKLSQIINECSVHPHTIKKVWRGGDCEEMDAARIKRTVEILECAE